jgi:alpha-tubulin suppressor-like RCC1 family protein
LLGTGVVKCWGRGEYATLGNGDVKDSTAPVAVTGITAATSISSQCAVQGGKAMCWGMDEFGQLGDGPGSPDKCTRDNELCAKSPVAASSLTDVTVVTSGSHRCARLKDGTTWCWGLNETGEIGSATTTKCTHYRGTLMKDCSETPVKVPLP